MMQQLLCPRSGSLLDAMQLINENGKGVVFLVDDRKQL